MIRRILTCGMFGLLLVISTTACGGDDTTGGPAGPSGPATTADPDGATTTRPTASTAAPATTTTTTTPPYSFDGSVPPPDLVNTGTDYVAIAESLDRYIDWLHGHNPDTALLERVFVVGSAVHERFESDLRTLSDRDLRMFDLRDGFAARVTGTRDGIITLMLTDRPVATRLVDRVGKVIDEQSIEGEMRAVGYLTLSQGRWLYADITPLSGDTTVQL